MFHFHVLTLFPRMFESPLRESILAKAMAKELIHVSLYDIRDFSTNRHRTVDDTPFGGGGGMVMKPEPLADCIEHVTTQHKIDKVVFLTPQGTRFDQRIAVQLSKLESILLICGHYEGVDERIIRLFVDMELSIGDFILTGGELPAMMLIDTVSRLLPNVVGNEASVQTDTFSDGLLKYPQYTKPRSFRGLSVPEILIDGDHEKIARWRRRESLKRTRDRRPELFAAVELNDDDRQLLEDGE